MMSAYRDELSSPKAPKPVPVGRRVFIGLTALGAAGVVFWASVANFFSGVLGSGLGGLLPGGDHFRIYSITGNYPSVSRDNYRLKVSGLVHDPRTFTIEDLEAVPSPSDAKAFQCVTGWRAPDVHWEGVQLSHILKTVGVKEGAVALPFESYAGADPESLTLDPAH